MTTTNDGRANADVETFEAGCQAGTNDFRLRRWLVSFRSGGERYDLGEFAAVSAADAIERAVAVFGPGDEPRAEEVPWDAAPLHRTIPRQ